MVVDYRFISKTGVSGTASEIIIQAGLKDWIFTGEVAGDLVFYKKIAKVRKNADSKAKEGELLYYSKGTINGLCHYALDDDFMELYEIWRAERKLNPSYKSAFTERSEKMFFKKLNKINKPVAMEMLNRAIESKWLALVFLSEYDINRVLAPYKAAKLKKENEMRGAKSEEELQENKDIESKIYDIIEIDKDYFYNEAKKYIELTTPSLTGRPKEGMINVRMRILAKLRLDKNDGKG